jgi:hypothetical protein
MRIPVFVSAPTSLNPSQEASRRIILDELDRYGLEERRLGASDYPTELPLKEVLVVARHCAGGVVLGFEQLRVEAGIAKPGTPREKRLAAPRALPTEWNHLEAGILFGLQLPLLVFREDGVEGGVFDHGVTDAFVHRMPTADMDPVERKGLSAVLLKWQSKVRERYYG